MPPGSGSAAGQNLFAPPYYSQSAVFVSPLSGFFILCCFVGESVFEVWKHVILRLWL